MKKRKTIDPRFSKWPKVRQYNDKIVISAKIMTSRRMFVLRKLVFKPLEWLWRFVAKVCVIELLFFLGGLFDAFSFAPCSRLQFYLLLVGVSMFWFLEKLKGHKLTRLVFGKRFIVKIYADRVQIGRWPFRKTFHRDQRLMFNIEQFFKAHDEVYQSSQRLCLIVGDARRVELLEVFGTLESTWLVNNLNAALRMSDPDNRMPDIAQPHRKRA